MEASVHDFLAIKLDEYLIELVVGDRLDWNKWLAKYSIVF